MRGLQQLDLAVEFRTPSTQLLALRSAPRDLAGLLQLSLSGVDLELTADARLPPGLTKLHLNLLGQPTEVLAQVGLHLPCRCNSCSAPL